MTVDELYALLTRNMSGSILSFSTSTFDQTLPIAAALKDLLGSDVASFDVVLGRTATSITLSGKGTAGPFNGMTLGAGSGFSIELDAPVLKLSGTSNDWCIAKSFPKIFGAPALAHLPAGPGAALTYTSYDATTKLPALTIDATLTLGSDWGGLAWLLAGTTAFHIAGSVAMHNGAAQFAQVTPISGSVTVGMLKDLKPTGTIETRALLPKGGVLDRTSFTSLRFHLDAQIPLLGGIPIRIDVSDPSGLVTITAELAAAQTVVLEDLRTFLELDAPFPLPSGDLYVPAGLTLEQLIFVVNPATKSISMIDIVVGSTSTWSLGDHLELCDVKLGFGVLFGAATTCNAFVSGNVAWDGGTLVLTAVAAQQYAFFAFLKDGSRVPLTSVLNYFLSTDLSGDLYLDDFDLSVTTGKEAHLSTTLSGTLPVSIGASQLTVDDAWLQIDRVPGSGTTGGFGGTLSIGSLKLDTACQIPGSVVFQAALPDIPLGTFVGELIGGTVDANIPTITLAEAAIHLSRTTDGDKAVYDAAVGATAKLGSDVLGSAVLNVLRAGGANAYAVGFATTADFSPGKLFPVLGDLFSDLSFSDSGLMVATAPPTGVQFPNLTMPSLPAQFAPGATFFTTMHLSGVLKSIGDVIGISDLNLSGVIDTAAPSSSTFSASLAAPSTHGAIAFESLVVQVSPGKETISLNAAATLTLGGETLHLAGAGSANLAKDQFVLSIMISQWKEPFGISGLTVNAFGISLSEEEQGFLGSFTIGSGDRQFTMEIFGALLDFEAPAALGFKLDPATKTPLKLVDLIAQFTTIHLDSVPVLNEIAFKQIEFEVVDDPKGFTIGTESFGPGISIHADVLVYSFECTLDVTTNTSRGVYAKGAFNQVLNIGGGLLVISDATGTGGASVLLDTGGTTKTPSGAPIYAQVSAGVVLLEAVKQTLTLDVSGTTFDFQYTFSFLGTQTLTANADFKAMTLAGAAEFDFDLDLDIPGYLFIPSVHLSGGAHLKMTLSLALGDSPGGSFGMQLHFSVLGVGTDLSFTLDVSAVVGGLDKLWDAVADWLKDNAEKYLGDIVKDAQKVLAAIKAGLFVFADGAVAIAKMLASQFSMAVADVAAALKDLGYAFDDVVSALKSVFSALDPSAIYDAVSGAFSSAASACGIAGAWDKLKGSLVDVSASQFAIGPTPLEPLSPAALAALTANPDGQELLVEFYGHRTALARAIADDHALYAMVHRTLERQDAVYDAVAAVLRYVADTNPGDLGDAARRSVVIVERHGALARSHS